MMMDEVSSPPVRRVVSAGASLACDLSWILSVAAHPSWRPKYPFLSDMFLGREELAERVRGFWSDQRHGTCFGEMHVLANHGGAITTTDPEVLWRALHAAAATVPLDLGLESETHEDRAAIVSRLQQLKASPELLRSYIDLLREVWEPLDELWQSALPRLEESGRQMQAHLERGGPLEELVPQDCQALAARLPEIAAGVDAGRPLLIVPCYFFGKSLYLELPGLTLIGTGIDHNDLGARARTESVALRLKTVADPTRLALLHYLATTPSTVGDLALSFQLAQPTVSMHIKLLRQGGLVQAVRRDGRLQLTTEPDAVEALLDDLRRLVGRGVGAANQVTNGSFGP
jgi:DNA-binding transcriptional ArsR family regulator